jgi:hypothetical protein
MLNSDYIFDPLYVFIYDQSFYKRHNITEKDIINKIKSFNLLENISQLDKNKQIPLNEISLKGKIMGPPVQRNPFDSGISYFTLRFNNVKTVEITI